MVVPDAGSEHCSIGRRGAVSSTTAKRSCGRPGLVAFLDKGGLSYHCWQLGDNLQVSAVSEKRCTPGSLCRTRTVLCQDRRDCSVPFTGALPLLSRPASY